MHMQAIVAETRLGKRVLSLLILASLLLLACLALRIMNYEFRRDELLYVSVVRLLDTHRLYQDFFYNHPPGSAWYFNGIHRILGTDHLLLAGRLGLLIAWVLFAAGVFLASIALTRSTIASWCIAVLSLLNALYLSQTGMTATNNFLPLPLSFIGLALFILEIRNPEPRPLRFALAGFCLALAVSLKLNAVAFIVPVAVAALFVPAALGLTRRLKLVVLPLLLGGLVGGAPVLWYLLSDPARFLAHVVGYHLGPHAAYFRNGGSPDGDSVISLPDKILTAFGIWTASALAVTLAALLALFLFQRPLLRAMLLSPLRNLSASAFVVIGALVLSVLLSVLPTPSYPQYFAPPLVCLPLALALAFGAVGPVMRLPAQNVLIAASLTVLFVSAPQLLQFLGKAPRPSTWTVERVHRSGEALAQRMAQEGAVGKVATLSPIYPLEGGLDVYMELATGPFAYRTGDITSPDLAKFYRMTSPRTIGALLASDPPAALLLGFEPELEAPLMSFAEQNGYVRLPDFEIEDRYGSAGLYVRPR